jgi:hypothetical protein
MKSLAYSLQFSRLRTANKPKQIKQLSTEVREIKDIEKYRLKH